jgi:alpha-ketoglutarate-dependent taurine dioxygenase
VIPKIAGQIKIAKKWTFKGNPHSYIAARCENGKLQAKGQFTFTDATPARRHVPEALHRPLSRRSRSHQAGQTD